jgi:hypothetical protein
MIIANAASAKDSEPEHAKLVNKKKIAARYGISDRMIQDLMLVGFPFYKLCYIVRFDPAECDKFMDKFRNGFEDGE